MSSSSSLSAPVSLAASLLAYLVTYSAHLCQQDIVLGEHCAPTARADSSARTPDLGIVALGLPHQQGSSVSVQRVGRVRVAQELRQEDLEDVDHVEHG